MKKLKLPIIKEPVLESKKLSMDDFLKFVTFNLKYASDKRVNRKWKKMTAVNIPFHL